MLSMNNIGENIRERAANWNRDVASATHAAVPSTK